MVIFGASEMSRNMDLGDETTTMMCKFVVRASEASITKQIESNLQGWCDDLTDRGVEYMKATGAEKLKISIEKITLLKAAQPKKTPKTEEESEEEEDDEEEEEKKKKEKRKEKGTLWKLTSEETEHIALQAAVLQEWHISCKDRKYTRVN